VAEKKHAGFQPKADLPAQRLAAGVDARRILSGKEHEVRVRLDGLAQLWHIQLAVVVQQPAQVCFATPRSRGSIIAAVQAKLLQPLAHPTGKHPACRRTC
jgi:hypothetical protein